MKILLSKMALLPVLLLMLTSCSDNNPSVQSESPFITALAELSKNGPRKTEVSLSTLTNFKWDQVFYFRHYFSKKEVNEIIGARLFGNGFLKSFFYNDTYFQPGPLLVFMNDGSIVHAVSIFPPVYLLGSNNTNFSYSSARITSITPNPGPYKFGFVEFAQ